MIVRLQKLRSQCVFLEKGRCLQGKREDSRPGAWGEPTSQVDLAGSWDQSHSPGTLWSVECGRGAPPSPVDHGERRRSRTASLSREPRGVGELRVGGEKGARSSLRATRSRGCWESIGNEDYSSSDSSSGSRRASGHRHRAALGRGARALQTGRQMQNEEGKMWALPTLPPGLASSLSCAPSLLPAPASSQSDEGGTASTLGNA